MREFMTNGCCKGVNVVPELIEPRERYRDYWTALMLKNEGIWKIGIDQTKLSLYTARLFDPSLYGHYVLNYSVGDSPGRPVSVFQSEATCRSARPSVL